MMQCATTSSNSPWRCCITSSNTGSFRPADGTGSGVPIRTAARVESSQAVGPTPSCPTSSKWRSTIWDRTASPTRGRPSKQRRTAQRSQTLLTVHTCFTRRRCTVFPFASLAGVPCFDGQGRYTAYGSDPVTPAARSDYAANAGDQTVQWVNGIVTNLNQAASLTATHSWPNADAGPVAGQVGTGPATGICYFRSQVGMCDITYVPRTPICWGRSTLLPTTTKTAGTMATWGSSTSATITTLTGHVLQSFPSRWLHSDARRPRSRGLLPLRQAAPC